MERSMRCQTRSGRDLSFLYTGTRFLQDGSAEAAIGRDLRVNVVEEGSVMCAGQTHVDAGRRNL
jgi:hypothetical protein